jgi:hypothetical protein
LLHHGRDARPKLPELAEVFLDMLVTFATNPSDEDIRSLRRLKDIGHGENPTFLAG